MSNGKRAPLLDRWLGVPIADWWNVLVMLILGRALRERLQAFATGRLVDIGCGTKPYERLASRLVTEHIGVDMSDGPHGTDRIDVVATAYETGLPDMSFDTVLCTEVLEHLEEPQQAVNEAFRLLRPGGCAIYSVPLFWHLHEQPRDFFRYTEYGLSHLFGKAGFEVVEITPLSGFVATFTQELCYFLKLFRRGGIANPLWWMVPPVALAIQAGAYMINAVDPSTGFTMEYIAVVRRPSSAGTAGSLPADGSPPHAA